MKEIRKIRVFLGEDAVGSLQLTPSGGQSVFEYENSWIEKGFSISPWELPLKTGMIFSRPSAFDGGFATFEDSMPDGYGLYLLDRILRTKGTSLKELSPLQRLGIIGSAGMGALRYEPSVLENHNSGLDEHSDFDAYQNMALDVLSDKCYGDSNLLYYNSHNSGGARPKAVFIAEDGSHWLVKFRHIYDPEDIGRVEFNYMSAAAECGITVPAFRLLNDRYFAVRRFDISEGRRIHTLTAAALLQYDFRLQASDYSTLLAMTGYLTQDHIQVEEIFRRMVFNIVSVNKDDHAKNFSFLCDKGIWSLSPAYDLTWSPEGTRGEHATSVMYNGNPTLSDVMAAGKGIRIPEHTCREIIDQVSDICSERLEHFTPLK